MVKDFSQISNLVNWSVPFHVESKGYRRRYTFINGSSVFCFANVEFGVPVETPKKSISMQFDYMSLMFSNEVWVHVRLQSQNSF